MSTNNVPIPEERAGSSKKICTCPLSQWIGSEPNDSTCELTEEEHENLREERVGREATPWFVGDGKEPDFTNPERFETVGPLPGAVGAREYAALLVAHEWLKAQLAAQPSVQRFQK